MTTSVPPTRNSSPLLMARTSTPPLPPSRDVPKDFRSSLSAWWNNSSYKEARIAEERLLRRMAIYDPPKAQPAKGWFGWEIPADAPSPVVEKSRGALQPNGSLGNESATQPQVMPPVDVGGGLVATLRNVFIATPDPQLAPMHPADPRKPEPDSAASSSTSLTGAGMKGPERRKSAQNGLQGKKAKLVDYINTLEVSSPENANSREAVVVVHGYAAALGFFFRNWDAVSLASSQTSRRTFFLDWLGMGLSSRPSPSLMSSPSNAPIPLRVSRAEHFFLSALESWRASVGLDKMILVGHSLGGYLASAYAVRYPERVSGLILVSPAGIPRGPEYKHYATSDSQTQSERDEAVEAAQKELGEDEHEAKGEAQQWKKDRQQSALRKNAMKFFVWGWERGMSPFSILRSAGPWGPMLVGRYSSRRFAAQTEEDIKDLHSYIYNTSILKGSGEFCISHILAPGAHARIPIVDRISKVKAPVTFMYGSNDWMDVDGGHASVRELQKAGNESAAVHVVPNAGHHVYLDNPDETNKLIGAAIKAIPTFTV